MKNWAGGRGEAERIAEERKDKMKKERYRRRKGGGEEAKE
jgi:hypothetical protein